MIRRGACLPLLLLMAAGCGGAGAVGTAIGQSDKPPVDFSYTVGESVQHTRELRGRPVLLVLMRTSDLPSQIYMNEIKEAFFAAAGETRFLVLTIEPSEAPFVTLYGETEDLPFLVGIADQTVSKGETALGPVAQLPTTCLIDRTGKVALRTSGIIRAEELIAAVKKIERR